MKSKLLEPISRILRYGLLAAALLYPIVYLFVVFSRIQFPYELMWQEGASVDHVKRIIDGYKYYVEPSLEFVPSIYTPLFFYLSAMVSKLTGLGFLPLRLVSFISSLGSLAIIYFTVKRETGNTFPAFLGLCLFAATFELSGSWFDVGRPDSLFLFLFLAALYLLRFGDSKRSYFIAAILASLSFFTKQTALVIAVPVMLGIILANRRCAVFFIIPFVSIVAAGSLIINYIHDGWFNYYVYQLPRTTPIFSRYLVHFWVQDIILPLFIALLFAVFYFVSQRNEINRKSFFFYFFAAVGMFGASWYSRLRGGGYLNVMFPVYAIISILFGLGVNKAIDIIRAFPHERRILMQAAIYILCIVQFASWKLAYNPKNQIPTKMDLKAGDLLVEKLARIEGEVFSPNHGYLTVLAGKKSFANQMGMRDVLKTSSKDHAGIKDKFINEMKQAMNNNTFSAVIIDSFEPWYPFDMEKSFIKKERIFDDRQVFYPVTGMKTRPEYIYFR